MGYIRGFVHGATVGAVVALLCAPKRGAELRQELARVRDEWTARAQPTLEQAHSAYQSVRPTVESAVGRARQRMGRQDLDFAGL